MTLMLALPAWATADSREPVGAVLDASGTVTTLGDKPAKLELFDYLYEHQRIRVAANASMVLSLRSNRTDYVIQGPASLTVKADGLQFESGKAASSKARPDVVVSALLAGPRTQGAVRLRATRGITPTPGSVVTSSRPVLGWPAQGQGEYELVLSDSGSETETRHAVDGTRWQPAEALRWGHAYRWRVQPAVGTGLGASGSFTVISEADRDQLEQLRPAADASFAERVVYAKALEHLGVRDEARTLWQRLAAERPDSVALQGYIGQGN